MKREHKQPAQTVLRESVEPVSELTTNRLSVYLRCLNVLDAAGVRTVSSQATPFYQAISPPWQRTDRKSVPILRVKPPRPADTIRTDFLTHPDFPRFQSPCRQDRSHPARFW